MLFGYMGPSGLNLGLNMGALLKGTGRATKGIF